MGGPVYHFDPELDSDVKLSEYYDGKLIWQGRTADIDHSGDAHVDQFIHGRAEGPIRMQVRKL